MCVIIQIVRTTSYTKDIALKDIQLHVKVSMYNKIGIIYQSPFV